MKHIILSADAQWGVFLVPDEVAENLHSYCMEFCTSWLPSSPNAKKYRTKEGLVYTELDFIAYLNTWKFPDQISKRIENLGWMHKQRQVPQEYQQCAQFHF
ncbi:MAG: hypothetical protein ACRCZJ_04590 [Erysipelotrichaceae bacterium]